MQSMRRRSSGGGGAGEARRKEAEAKERLVSLLGFVKEIAELGRVGKDDTKPHELRE